MRAVRLLPSPAGLSCRFASGISEVSRFSCMEFPDVHGVYDYAGPTEQLALALPGHVAFRCG